MKEKHEIIDELCKPYGGFADVITRYGATFISQLWMKSMDLYAEQSRQAAVSGSLLADFPENRPLYKDSGLWQMRTDDMEDVIIQQGVNESDAEFIERCKASNDR